MIFKRHTKAEIEPDEKGRSGFCFWLFYSSDGNKF